MTVAIGSDHGGYDLRCLVRQHLLDAGYEVIDCGCPDRESVDYPVYGHAVAETLLEGNAQRGIVICTTGIGISMTANRHAGIRCALCTDTTMARLTRLHNDANVLAMGAAIIGERVAMDIVDTFLETEFSGEERHERRIREIEL